MSTTEQITPALADQAGILKVNAAGYMGHRATGMGLRTGLIRTLADEVGGPSQGQKNRGRQHPRRR